MNPPRILITEDGLMMEKNRIQLRINIDAAKASNLTISSEVLRAADVYVFSAMVGMARCAVPARVVAGGTNFRATLAFEGVAPLHAARTSQRDVPTTLNRYRTSVRPGVRPGGPPRSRRRRIAPALGQPGSFWPTVGRCMYVQTMTLDLHNEGFNSQRRETH